MLSYYVIYYEKFKKVMCQTEKEALMSDRNILSKLMCLLIFFSELCILVFNLKLKSNSFPLKSNLFPVTTIIK